MANFGTERVYQNFEPATRWTSEPDAEILVADLPGFKKEQLKVAVTATRKLRLSGERPTGGNKWIRFHKEIPVPSTVDTDSVSAMFKDNKLHIRHPKIKRETTQTKPPAIMKPHEPKQRQGSTAMVEKPNGGKKTGEVVQSGRKESVGEPMSSKDEEKDKVGAKWFEKYKEATGNVVKEAKNKRRLLCNLVVSILMVLLFLLYARNALRSSLIWKTDE